MCPAANVMKNIGSNVMGKLGYVAKAQIDIIDVRPAKVGQPSQPVVAGGSGKGISVAVSSIPTAALTDTLLPLAGITDTSGLPAQAVRRSFQVQFNPSDLTISASGGQMIQKIDTSKGGGNVTYEAADTTITMSVKLIFDKADSQNAFMADRLNYSPTGLLTNVAKGALSLAGMKNYSVQTEVEGFLAAARDPRTTMIAFRWGAMYYAGVISHISAEYKMFNLDGEPVRAEINLSILCVDDDLTKGNMGDWAAMYNKAFAGDKLSLVKSSQKVGNLLNFNL